MKAEVLSRTATYPGEGWPKRRFKWNGEKRPPKAGEYYLSGAIITAYRTLGDMSYPYHIAVPVEEETCKSCGGSGKVVKG